MTKKKFPKKESTVTKTVVDTEAKKTFSYSIHDVQLNFTVTKKQAKPFITLMDQAVIDLLDYANGAEE